VTAGGWTPGAGRWKLIAGSCLAALIGLTPPAQAQTDSVRIVFVGDMNFARSLARNYLFTGRGHEVFAGVRDELRGADIAVGNLESILLERGNRTDTTNSPVFAGPQHLAIPLLLDAGFDVIGTANNHAWDFGRPGLIENLRWLDSAGIPNTGTGANLARAWRPVIVERNGWRIAFFAITAMFNYPDLTVVGHDAECCVAWLDTLDIARRVDGTDADVRIAFIHQSPVEYQAVPHYTVVRQFRALARSGHFDAIIAHHPHVPQGVEWVGDVPIVYSLGNFVFKQAQPWTDRGLWAELTLRRAGTETLRPGLRLRPLVVGYTPRFATGADSARVMAHVDSISRLISDLPRVRPRRNVARPRSTQTPARP
jgi:poly-gamma-glutamate synthesis protein (capsule biosynthesis protein)